MLEVTTTTRDLSEYGKGFWAGMQCDASEAGFVDRRCYHQSVDDEVELTADDRTILHNAIRIW